MQYIKGSSSPPHLSSQDHPLPRWMPPILLLLQTSPISAPWHQVKINNKTSLSKLASLEGSSRQKQQGWQRGSYQLGGGGGSLAEVRLCRRYSSSSKPCQSLHPDVRWRSTTIPPLANQPSWRGQAAKSNGVAARRLPAWRRRRQLGGSAALAAAAVHQKARRQHGSSYGNTALEAAAWHWWRQRQRQQQGRQCGGSRGSAAAAASLWELGGSAVAASSMAAAQQQIRRLARGAMQYANCADKMEPGRRACLKILNSYLKERG